MYANSLGVGRVLRPSEWARGRAFRGSVRITVDITASESKVQEENVTCLSLACAMWFERVVQGDRHGLQGHDEHLHLHVIIFQVVHQRMTTSKNLAGEYWEKCATLEVGA